MYKNILVCLVLSKNVLNPLKQILSKSFLISKKLIRKHLKKFVSACEKEHYPFEKPFHQIYKKELCISPIPALAVHCTNVNSIFGLSPFIDYKKLWEKNKLWN